MQGVRRGDPEALREAEALAAAEHEPAWVSGSCLLARRQAIDAVGLFDEGFFLYEEDVDLCVRVRAAGWRIVFTPAAEVVHHLGRQHGPGATSASSTTAATCASTASTTAPEARLLLRGALAARGGLGWLTARGPRAAEDRGGRPRRCCAWRSAANEAPG